VNWMSSKVTAQPSPVGGWASKPIETGPDGSSIVKKRIIRHVVPLKDAWYAMAWSQHPRVERRGEVDAHAGAELEVAGRWDPEQRRGVEHRLRVEGGARAGVGERCRYAGRRSL